MRALLAGGRACPRGVSIVPVLLAAVLAWGATGSFDPRAVGAEKAARYTRRVHFAEAEIVLDSRRTLQRLLAFPRAPGSHPQVLEGGTHVRVQLPAAVVGELIEEGADVTVLRDFMLLHEPVPPTGIARRILVAPAAPCSGTHETASNDADYPVPENNWTHSDIVIDTAPAEAVVVCIDVHYEIIHTYVSDLIVDLANQDGTVLHRLWHHEGGAAADINQTATGMMDFAGQRVNQTWKLRATDSYPADTGYIDSWWIKVYYEVPVDILAHDEPNDPALVQDGIPYMGTTTGATGQYETRCGYLDVLDVWHSYTPAHAGLVSIRVESDSFDTTLAVFDAFGVERACGDDDCDSTNSIVTMPMAAGAAQLIRVAGYDHETGDYTLTVNQHPPALPDVPSQPVPADGSDAGTAPATLSWNGPATSPSAIDEQRAALKADGGSRVQPKTIYGRDDRVEQYDVTDPNLLAVGDATAILVFRQDLLDNGDGTYRIEVPSFAWWYDWLDPLGTGNSLCDDEPFRDQPSVGICTGVLVAPDLVATAGHCIACTHPNDIAVVFGFVMQDANTATTTLSADQVYWPTDTVACQAGHPDWGLLKLDRAVAGRMPLPVRRTGQVADDQRLVLVGYPWGVPKKYDAGAVVTENTEPTFFQANVDTYQGNSGSPVVNLDTLTVEGLLVRGMEDFVEDVALGCDRSLACPDGGCPDGQRVQWQDVTRATTFSVAVPSFEVYLGTDPDHLELAATDLIVPSYEPGPLRKEAVYYWRVVACNACGRTEGPLWSFRTAPLALGVRTDEETF